MSCALLRWYLWSSRSCNSSVTLFIQHSAPPEIHTLSLHDALPIFLVAHGDARALGCEPPAGRSADPARAAGHERSEEHTSELQSRQYLVCRLLLEKKRQTLAPGFEFPKADAATTAPGMR